MSDSKRKPSRKDGLTVEIRKGRLVIGIGVQALAWACEHAPNLERYDEPKADYLHPVVTDPAAFAKEVLRELRAEEEDGTTRVHRLLDAAFEEAIEQGAEGVRMPGDDE